MTEIHRLLKRQLERLDISYEQLPLNQEQWREFIDVINKYYYENDQERYLLERSMEVSSSELVGINEQLEYAQKLARLCYWQWSPTSYLIHWSKNIFELLALDSLSPAPAYYEFINMIHEQYREKVKKAIENSFITKLDVDLEILLEVQDNQHKWFRIIISNKENAFVSGILIDINKEKETTLQIKELNKTLLTTARLAGMSEIATTILHNIGNLLNSIIVSIMVLKKNSTMDFSSRFFSLVKLIKEHEKNLGDYLVNDPKGKLILPYIEEVAENMQANFTSNNEHIARLEKNLNHVKEIVTMQQAISGISGIKEDIILSELIENAIQLSNIQSKDIFFTWSIEKGLESIHSDKSKLLQILTNLLRNSKDAVISHQENSTKEIALFIQRYTDDQISIKVKDNGIGIPDEIQKKIFSFGFTTKENGHGFGLHSSALAAQELGGSLNVQSKGKGTGAEFNLIVPIRLKRRKEL